MTQFSDNPILWRERAEEARVQAEQMHDHLSRLAMFRIAEGYDNMAKRAEERIAQGRSREAG